MNEKTECASKHPIEHFDISDYKLIHQSKALDTKTYCNGTIHMELYISADKMYWSKFQCDCHIWRMLNDRPD